MRTQLLLTIFLIVNFSILIKRRRRAGEQTKHVFVQFDIAYRFVRSFICSFIRVAHSFRGVLNTRSFSLLSQQQTREEKQQPFLLLQVGRCTLKDISNEHSWRPKKKKSLTTEQMYTVTAIIVFCSRFCVSVGMCDKL